MTATGEAAPPLNLHEYEAAARAMLPPMVWDYVEINPFSSSVGNFLNHTEWVADSVDAVPASGDAVAIQLDATASPPGVKVAAVSSDPPYYSNIGYADLSDFFYVWPRRSLGSIHPELFGTLVTPKVAELVAAPYRFNGDKAKAEAHFEHGLGDSGGRGPGLM